MQEGVVEVLASHGDTHLGGDDFDAALAEHLMQRFEAEHAVNLRFRMWSGELVLQVPGLGLCYQSLLLLFQTMWFRQNQH